ncbi:MAG: PHP domain-containing protein [Candidatus Bathyarchaeota archaeon]|nr:PHP domain-containing protein [Candidatus Bathyarchaeota archaeon]
MNCLPLKMDLHVHTCYSYDATTTLREVVVYAKKRGLDGVAITDHDTVEGALKLAQKSNLLIVPCVEVTTQRGHVLALNVTTPIPPGLSLFETIQRIHEVGGIAVAAHPTAVYKGGLRRQIIPSFDAVEVINSKTFPFFLSTYLGRKVAIRLNLPQTAGSDAHHASEIGLAYTLIEADPDIDEIIRAIKRGAAVPVGKPITWKTRLQNAMSSLKRRRM